MTTFVNASLPGTEVRTVTAQSNGHDYRISVALPPSYNLHCEQSYPTIFLIDANFYFGMATELTRMMSRGDELPETIVVGIGYPTGEPLADANNEVTRFRTRDLTPIPDPAKSDGNRTLTGEAPAFLSFIQFELIPLIERDYRTNSAHRVLAGHSFGALFTLYALFHQPDLFTGYVAGSPSLWYGKRVTFDYEAAFAERHTSLPVKLYLGVGGLEEDIDYPMVSDFFQFIVRLESRNYTGLVLTKQIVENCDHRGFTAITFQAGLQAALSDHSKT